MPKMQFPANTLSGLRGATKFKQLMAHDVFISHSSKDKQTADAICHYLEQNGIRCWIAPRDILPGEDWFC